MLRRYYSREETAIIAARQLLGRAEWKTREDNLYAKMTYPKEWAERHVFASEVEKAMRDLVMSCRRENEDMFVLYSNDGAFSVGVGIATKRALDEYLAGQKYAPTLEQISVEPAPLIFRK
jgi:hypothetical protein